MDIVLLDATRDMLKSLLAGHSYDTIGQQHGITKTAVAKRILQLATELQNVVGVDGVDEDEFPSAHLLRRHRSAYLEALGHYVPQARLTQVAAMALGEQRIAWHTECIRRHSRNPYRDAALFATLFSTAARPGEIARLVVADYLDAAGAVRNCSLLRAEIAANGKARPLPFRCSLTNDVIDAYLSERLQAGYGTSGNTGFRGLAPSSPLFLSRCGQPLAIRRPDRPLSQTGDGRDIHDLYRRIFSHAGLPDMNTLGVRRSVALGLRSRGAPLQHISETLGLTISATRRLIEGAGRHSQPAASFRPHASRAGG